MPKARVNGTSKARAPPTDASETAITPQTTPRRSKRKLDAIDAEDLSPLRPSKSLRAEVNGKEESAATTPVKSEPSSTPRSSRSKRLPKTAETPTKPLTQDQHRTLKEKAKEIVEKFEHKVETIVDGKKLGKSRDRKKTSTKEENDVDAEDGGLEDIVGKGDPEGKPKTKKKQRKSKEEKESEMIPLAARSAGLRMYVGAHVSMAGGVENAIKNSLRIGGNAFALFLKSQRKWDNPALKDENRAEFLAMAKQHGYDQSRFVLPHGSYLVNLAVEDTTRAKQAYDAFVDDFHRCEALGIRLYNFHPGAYSSSTLSEGISRIATQLNRAFSESQTVVAVLENASGGGTVIGSHFNDLRDIIAQISPQYKSRVGVCIDTCHAFAAGYDLRTPESFRSVLEEFDNTVGIEYLKALHVNDSKAPLSSKKDLHQNIGLGFLGLRAFHNVMNEPRFENLPLILETPCDVPVTADADDQVPESDPDPPKKKGKGTAAKPKPKLKADPNIWAREIKLLESLIGMDPEGEEFQRLETELSEQGKEEREKVLEAIRKAEANKMKKAEKGQKTLLDMFGGSASKKAKGGKKGKKKEEESADESELSEFDEE